MSSTSALNSLLSSSSASSSSSINLSSILTAATGATSTGIDVASAVDAAIYAARAPERQWQAQQSTVQSQMSVLSSVESAVATLSTDLSALNDLGGALATRTATSSDTSVVTATASAGVATGNHSITVQNLASSASWYSSPLSTAAATLGSSSLQITQANGTQTNFALGTNGNTSLTALAGAINTAALGINASVVTDALGSRLALVSQSTGAASSFTVSDTATTAASWTSASVASASSSLAASTFQISNRATTTSISVAAGSSLTTVANQINAAGPSLSAHVVTDASGAHLSIASGIGGSVTVTSDPVLQLTQSSAGTNASLKVDGVPITSASNTVTGAIPGLTLNLQSVSSTSPVTIAVSADTNQTSSTLSQFVTDYNSALSLVNSQFTFNPATGTQGALGGDAAVRTLQSALLSITGYNASATGISSSHRSLASLGISVNNDGSLTLNAAQLNQALATNASAAQNFFQGAALDGFAATTQSALQLFNNPATGVLAADMRSMTKQYSDLQTNVNNFESGYIASQKTVLTTMYSKAEIALQQLPTMLKQIQGELGNQNSGG